MYQIISFIRSSFKEINPFLADYKVRVYPDTTTGFTEGKFLQNMHGQP